MRRLLAIGFGLWVCTASLCAEQYVLPGRADLGVYHFDKTSLPLGIWTNTTQWLIDDTLEDFSPARASKARVIGVNCLSGTAVTITAPHLNGTETVASNDGTATPVITANTITFTGTLGNLVLSDGTIYPCQEGKYQLPMDASGQGNHSTATTATYSTSDDMPSHNRLYGCSERNTALVMTWTTTETPQDITIPTTGTGYDGTVQWEEMDGTIVSTETFDDGDMSALTKTLPSAGSYRSRIVGEFPAICFFGSDAAGKLDTVENLGWTGMTSLHNAFRSATSATSIDFGDTDAHLRVTSLYGCTIGADNMVESPDYSEFSKVTTIRACGYQCPNMTTFHFPLSINNLASALYMLMDSNNVTPDSIDEILSRAANSCRANNDQPANIDIHLGANKRSTAGTVDYNYLVSIGWIITGGTL